jgi:hypothetical protein
VYEQIILTIKQLMNKILLSLHTDDPQKVCCVVIFGVEDFDSAIADSFMKGTYFEKVLNGCYPGFGRYCTGLDVKIVLRYYKSWLLKSKLAR